MILGGLNASVGNQEATATRETFQGSARRAAFKGMLAKLPQELQLPMSELLDWVVFRDELPFYIAEAAGPSFGKIDIGGSLLEATIANDTAVFTHTNTGVLYGYAIHISKDAEKTANWNLNKQVE
jgi:hypothetical protein